MRYRRAVLAALVLSLALAADATAVAAARAASGARQRDLLILAVVFGVFQGGMAALGWLGGAAAEQWLSRWDHWVAFTLLAGIGAKMLLEASRATDEPQEPTLDPRTVLLLAIATSLDALAAGVTLPLLPVAPALSVALITGVTAALSLLGGLAGRAAGMRLGRPLAALGGLALIGIGARILVEHLG